jgi:hypothetical protein
MQVSSSCPFGLTIRAGYGTPLSNHKHTIIIKFVLATWTFHNLNRTPSLRKTAEPDYLKAIGYKFYFS